MSGAPALAPDAEIVLGIASTAMPFARTPEDEAERWLRVLRLHGEAGAALQALGVSEGPLREAAEHGGQRPTGDAGESERDPVAQVAARAAQLATARGSGGVATTDVLLAVLDVYGEDFERVLQTHGTERDAVLERLRVAPTAG